MRPPARPIWRSTNPPTQIVKVAASDTRSHPVTLGVGKSVVIDLPRDIKDVLVADPKIANAVVRSSRRAYIIGIASRRRPTSSFSMPKASRSPASTSRSRAISTASARRSGRCIPDADVTVEGIGDGIILTGTVASQARGAAGLRHRIAFRRCRWLQRQHWPNRRHHHHQRSFRRERQRSAAVPARPARSSTPSSSAAATKSC